MQGANPWTPGLFVPYRRAIGGIYAQVTIQELERQELVLTTHPIEQGAPINDHAYRRPAEVTIRAGWSAAWAGDLSDVSGVYGALLAWQASLQPFDLYTGKRHYRNMLIQSINVTTDEQSEFALMAEIICHEIVVVKTSVTQAQSSPASSNNTSDQKDPASNATQKDKGDQSTKQVPYNQENPEGAPTNVISPPSPDAPYNQENPPPGGIATSDNQGATWPIVADQVTKDATTPQLIEKNIMGEAGAPGI